MAKQLGYEVSGSDENVYPPMSTQLEQQGIRLCSGYRSANLNPTPDLVVIGNALSRGNEEIEAVLNSRLPYVSGPQWLGEHFLKNRWVLAVAGTHGKTTCSSMLAWILDCAGLDTGFLIGGIPKNFGVSARLGTSEFFVVEADEYDTAFFDKRSKFVHYHPRTAIFNNLEFDHADIFPDLDAIQRQFHHFVRTIPGKGLIVVPAGDKNLQNVLQRGCWTPVESIALSDLQGAGENVEWRAELINADGSQFEVFHNRMTAGILEWNLTGTHNVHNGLAAIAAAHHAGVDPSNSLKALSRFMNVKRRMEIRSVINEITIYDDFAHHPTAISTTLQGLRAHVGDQRIIAIIEPRSNTMRAGVHADKLPQSVECSDNAIFYRAPDSSFPFESLQNESGKIRVFNSIEAIIDFLRTEVRSGDNLVFMSNGGFGGIYLKAEEMLKSLPS